MKVVVVDKIHKQYHDHVIFDDFSMEIEQGSFGRNKFGWG